MKRLTIYILALGVFLTATSELVISGILNIISKDLNISLALSGQLVTIYSLAFAFGTPVIISLTSRMGRKSVVRFTFAVYSRLLDVLCKREYFHPDVFSDDNRSKCWNLSCCCI